MPADLKKVARELQDLFDSLDYHNSDIDLPAVEFILQTLVSQAMEEAAKIAEKENERWDYFNDGCRASQNIVREIRRRASGKEE
jgi:hypothetical protein